MEHKRTKNEIASLGIAEHYANADFVSPRVDEERRIVEIPRPAGVVFALTPVDQPDLDPVLQGRAGADDP